MRRAYHIGSDFILIERVGDARLIHHEVAVGEDLVDAKEANVFQLLVVRHVVLLGDLIDQELRQLLLIALHENIRLCEQLGRLEVDDMVVVGMGTVRPTRVVLEANGVAKDASLVEIDLVLRHLVIGIPGTYGPFVCLAQVLLEVALQILVSREVILGISLYGLLG